jgi:hypothetical protein
MTKEEQRRENRIRQQRHREKQTSKRDEATAQTVHTRFVKSR